MGRAESLVLYCTSALVNALPDPATVAFVGALKKVSLPIIDHPKERRTVRTDVD